MVVIKLRPPESETLATEDPSWCKSCGKQGLLIEKRSEGRGPFVVEEPWQGDSKP